MDIEFLKSQLEDVRQQMRGKNRNNPVEAAEYVELKKDEDALIEMITAAQKEQTLAELEQETVKQVEERTQQQEQHITGLMDFVTSLSLFELTIGEQQESGLGINEYQERRELFNGILYQAIVEKQKELMTSHNEEVAQKDTTINEVTAKCVGLEASLAKVVTERDESDEENYRLKNDNQKLEAENEALGKTNFEQLQKITQLEGDINRLQTTLENERKAKPVAAPSKSLEEQLAEYKKAIASSKPKVLSKEKLDITGRQWKITHLDGSEEVVNGIDQAKFVIATEADIEEARFHAGQDTQADREDDTETSVTLGTQLEVPTFQKPDDAEGVHGVQQEADEGNNGHERKDDVPVSTEQVSRQEFEALQARVIRLEKVANLPEAV